MSLFSVDIELLRSIFAAIKDLAQNASLGFLPDALSIKAMDAANICFLVATLQRDRFASYATDEPFHFSLNVGLMCTALQCMRQKKGLLFVLATEHELVLTSADGCARFKVGSYADPGSDIVIPDGLVYEHSLALPSRELKEATGDVLGLCDEALLRASAGCFELATHPNDTLHRSWPVPSKSTATVELRLGTQYFHSMCKHSGLAPTVTLELDPELPVRLVYAFGPGSQLEFYLAPMA